MDPIRSFVGEYYGALERVRRRWAIIRWQFWDGNRAFSLVECVADVESFLVNVIPCQGVRGVSRNVQELDTEGVIFEGQVLEMPGPVRDGVFWSWDAKGFALGVCGEIGEDEGGLEA